MEIWQQFDLGRYNADRQEYIDLLRAYAKAHRNITFPADCVGVKVGSVDLVAAIKDLHLAVFDFLDSDQPYNDIGAETLDRLHLYQVAFGTAIRRRPHAQDYFERAVDLIGRLEGLQYKQR